MKKTIAILLILVIGMVGVFAAEGTAVLDLKTTVAPIDAMAIVAATAENAPDFSTILGTSADFTSFTTNGTAVPLSDDTTTAQDVGKLYTYSNRRLYQVKIVATPLSSTTNNVTAYMDYTVSGGSNGTTDTTFATAGAGTSTTEVVFYNHAATTVSGAVIGADGKMIKVKMDTAQSAVPAGLYEGSITFNYYAM